MLNFLPTNISSMPKNNLHMLKAHWVRRDTILWNTALSQDYIYSLFAFMDTTPGSGTGSQQDVVEIELEFCPGGMDDELKQKFPHLASSMTFKLSVENLSKIPDVLKGQLGVVVRDINGGFVDVTGVQIPGVLDDLYTYQGPLGVQFSGMVPTLSLWAPTARSVRLFLYENASTSIARQIPLAWDEFSGVWRIQGKSSWINKYYLFEVEVYVPAIGKIEKNLVTDPYSISLSTNSQRSQIVDLKSNSLKPHGWDTFSKPALAALEDMTVYELHVRDFSMNDQSVPTDLRGTYRAFTKVNSRGMKHLKSLAESGLTHLQLLPVFDIATINEDKSTWRKVDEESLAHFPPASDLQQKAVNSIRDYDGYNWGYDPCHYTTPEGSYATDPNGTPRILQFREMIQALGQIGLRVVMDVVYNHTFASGLDLKSVFDKVVPDYYYRLNGEGKVEQSTCCSNTASEHAMMRKLMIDSLLTWVRQYRIDGFRFDLMGHHMLADMREVRAALDALTIEKDGVDGKLICMYGEGWNFGEVANNARGLNAVQQNIAGSGIGVFNDRLRDAVRGGSHYGFIYEQGFVTGMFFQPNSNERRGHEYQKWRLFEYEDWIRVSLAGNLKNFRFIRANGDEVPANQIFYNGSPAGYTLTPRENIVYVAAHDNETLWDILQVKLSSDVTLSERVRLNNLALSLVAFSQGIPFFHAGDDLLRSKSIDRNSYNSGDWFNKIDWSYETNNWGVGLPFEGQEHWDTYRPLLENVSLKPRRSEIAFSVGIFREYLKIRKSSPLFRLQTGEAVQRCLSFTNTGPEQIPGFIIMHLDDVDQIDTLFSHIVVFFNTGSHTVTYSEPEMIGSLLELHPVQAASIDEIVKHADFDMQTGQFTIPERTTVIFVKRKDRYSPNAQSPVK